MNLRYRNLSCRRRASIPSEISFARMSNESLQLFCASIWRDGAVMAELRAETDRNAFIARMIELSDQAGYRIGAAEFEQVLSANYLSWLQRWA